jgi:Domain of unknown function (DUF4279)
MKHEIVVRLRVFSERLRPDEITARIGLQPDAAVAKGEYHKGKTVPAKRTEWQLGSGLSRVEPLDQHVPSLLRKLAPSSENIRSLVSVQGCECSFSCVLYTDAAPALYFEPQWISDIAKLGAALDIDLYLPETSPSGAKL